MSLIQTFPDGGGGGVINGSTVTPTDDVSIWLACAGLHQSYTTLNEVLADSAVLSALMASTNAVDYLVRSTTWATTICADETAMNCIGANDYCADILLDNSTWGTAICNSVYFEEVLNVKVPTMTSATQPSGEVICYSSVSPVNLTSYPPYYAFNANYSENGGGLDFSSPKNGKGSYIGYDFKHNVRVYKIAYKFNMAGANLRNYSLIASNNGSDWNTIDSFSVSHNVESTLLVNSGADYRMYAFEYNDDSSVQIIYGKNLQFYGRGKSPVVDTKADISAIAPEEAGSTSSRAYAVGEHFYKNGKFCTCIQAIAQGAQFTLGTNYVEGTIADAVCTRKYSYSWKSSKVTSNSRMDLYKTGKVLEFIGQFTINQNTTSFEPLFKYDANVTSDNIEFCFLRDITDGTLVPSIAVYLQPDGLMIWPALTANHSYQITLMCIDKTNT